MAEKPSQENKELEPIGSYWQLMDRTSLEAMWAALDMATPSATISGTMHKALWDTAGDPDNTILSPSWRYNLFSGRTS